MRILLLSCGIYFFSVFIWSGFKHQQERLHQIKCFTTIKAYSSWGQWLVSIAATYMASQEQTNPSKKNAPPYTVCQEIIHYGVKLEKTENKTSIIQLLYLQINKCTLSAACSYYQQWELIPSNTSERFNLRSGEGYLAAEKVAMSSS